MSESVIVTYKDIEVYQSDIDILCDEYISTLPLPEMVFKTSGFMGLLEYIYRHKLKEVVVNNVPYGYDYHVLNDIFYNIYMPLCSRYGTTPTIVQFASFIKVDNSNFTDVKNGVYRSNGSRVNPENTQTVKRWFSSCESAILSKAIDTNGIGAIFALKASYQYKDNQTVTIESGSVLPHESAEQIAARHAAASLPEKPEI